MKYAIIYLHGFNSASLSLSGELLHNKEKLVVLDQYCQEQNIKFCALNIDYRNFVKVISDLTQLFNELTNDKYQVIFMGSSLGGFTSEYMAMKLNTKAVMINPAIVPSELLVQFIGVTENYEIALPFNWTADHCQQYQHYETELKLEKQAIDRTILIDMADELIDSSVTLEKYKDIAQVVTYQGGSHSFEHIKEALPVIDKVIKG